MSRARWLSSAVSLLCTLVLLLPEAEAVSLTGGATSDALFGSAAPDVLSGGAGFDFLFGKENPNSIRKRRRNGRRRRVQVRDVVRGGDDIDALFGGSGRDILEGGDDADGGVDDDGLPGDVLRGGLGSDFLFSVDGGADSVDCGGDEADDVAFVDQADVVTGCTQVYAGQPLTPIPTLFGPTLIYGTTGNDGFVGTASADALAGGPGNDVIDGGDDNDLVFGGSGTDTISGGAGSDQLVDDDGTPGDTLTASDGADDIFSADGAADIINCSGSGAGSDIYADPEDTISVDCVGTTHIGESFVEIDL